jgi:hypothetical protein
MARPKSPGLDEVVDRFSGNPHPTYLIDCAHGYPMRCHCNPILHLLLLGNGGGCATKFRKGFAVGHCILVMGRQW